MPEISDPLLSEMEHFVQSGHTSHPTWRLLFTDEEPVAKKTSFSLQWSSELQPRGQCKCRDALPRLRDDERTLNDTQSVVP